MGAMPTIDSIGVRCFREPVACEMMVLTRFQPESHRADSRRIVPAVPQAEARPNQHRCWYWAQKDSFSRHMVRSTAARFGTRADFEGMAHL